MTRRTGLWSAVFAVACALAWVTPAQADAIDGDWCNGPASLHIQGQAIRTPGGRDIVGDYSRHAFSYLAPAGEADAGAKVIMHLLGEQDMELFRDVSGTSGPMESWKRCQPVS